LKAKSKINVSFDSTMTIEKPKLDVTTTTHD